MPLFAVCAGYFMVILDVTVINVAVPVIGRELAASLTGIQWITDGYTLVLAGFLLTAGALGDRLGNRRVFCWAPGCSCWPRPGARSRRTPRPWWRPGWSRGSARR
ncbi:MFS transporter [Streptomyces bungoensis]|nr:MFS transporter [Streptomyces bungoensis]